jgi:hypothetical protein
MHTPVPVRERSLEELLWQVMSARAQGLVVLRDRDGLRHGVWVQGGYVVGVHVAGRFDPLLDLLRRHGSLSAHGYRACVDALYSAGVRSGSLAMEVAGVDRAVVRDALRRQSYERMAALLELALTRGHDAWLEEGDVPGHEVSVRMPLGALFRHAPGAPRARQPAPQSADREQARRRLRELARRLHPDLNGHLDAEQRRALEADLSRETARYHGFAS